MSWRPLHDLHAIEKARLRIRFDNDKRIPPKVVKSIADDLDKRRSQLGFDSSSPHTGAQFGFRIVDGRPEVASETRESVGRTYNRTVSNGATVEGLVIDPDEIVFETAEYGRWDLFFERFRSVSGYALKSALSVTDATHLIVEYVDRFIFDGAPEKADPSLILLGLEGALHEEALSGKSLWHLHRGWFEDLNGHPLLINQNLDAQMGQRPDQSSVRSVQIYTKAEYAVGSRSLDENAINADLEALHKRNNQVFSSRLTQAARDMVNIREENYA